MSDRSEFAVELVRQSFWLGLAAARMVALIAVEETSRLSKRLREI